MCIGYDPFKWADDINEDVEEYQKNFKEVAKKIIEEMNLCLQQKNDKNTSEDQTSRE